MSDQIPTPAAPSHREHFEREHAQYLAACDRIFDLSAWLDAKANRARYEATIRPA